MTTVAGVLLAFGALWLVGTLISGALGLRENAGPTAGFLEIAMGQVVLATVGMTTIVLGGRVSLGLVYGFLAIVAVAAFAAGGRVAIPKIGSPRGAPARALLLVALLVWLVLAAGTLGDRLLWDAWAFWTLKARAIFIEGRLPPDLLTLAGAYPWTHPEYPLGLPLFDWWISEHLGEVRFAAVSFAGAVWLAFLPILLWAGLREEAGEKWAAGVALAAVCFWPVTMSAIGGYAEILISLGLLGAVLELGRGIGPQGRGSTARLALFMCFAVVAKNEGQALAVVAAIAAAWSLWNAGVRRIPEYAVLGAPFVVVAPWLVYTRILGVSAEHIGGLPPLPELLARIPFLAFTFVELFATRAWIPVGFLLLAGFAARRLRGAGDVRAAWGLVLGYFAVTQIVLLLTPLDLEWLVVDTYFRLIGTILPAAVLLCVREIARLPVGELSSTSLDPVGATVGSRL